MQDRCYETARIMYTLGDCIDAIFGDYNELHRAAEKAWKDGIEKHSKLVIRGKKSVIGKYTAKIEKYDETYITPGACYIATAVYGSYDCPQVWTLRRFRDDFLAKTLCGCYFIKLYYSVSPVAVRLFGRMGWFRAMWRRILDRMVERLNAKGVESTPYNDK